MGAGEAVVSRPPSQRAGLSRQRIVAAAMALVERDGPDALSMRRLGAELGVEAMSLYHHVVNRDALVRAIGERMLEPLRDTVPADGWRAACERFAWGLRAIAVAHPATFRLVGLEPLDTPASLRPVEDFLAVLVADGFAPRDALAVYRAIAAYARGYALAEATGFTVDAARLHARKRLSALPRGEFPILRGRARELAALDANGGFELGLRALIDGLPSPA